MICIGSGLTRRQTTLAAKLAPMLYAASIARTSFSKPAIGTKIFFMVGPPPSWQSLRDHEHVTARQADQFLRNAADEQPEQPAPSPLSDDNGVGLLTLRDFKDERNRITET